MGRDDELKKAEEKLNELKDEYQHATDDYNKKTRPLFHMSQEISRLRSGIAKDNARDVNSAKKVSELEQQLSLCEKDVDALMKALEEKMQQIAQMEKVLYGQRAAKPDSPDILEKKEVYTSKSPK